MKFDIENQSVFTTLKISLQRGESFRTEGGAMLGMSPNITLQAKSTGKGIIGTFKAAVGGESILGSVYTAEHGDGDLLIAPSTLGDILHINLNDETIYANGGAYLAGDLELILSTKGSIRSMISGEGLFLQKITGSGNLFLSSYGKIIEKEIKAGESFIVDTGHIVAFESKITYNIKKAAKGIFSSIATGEGLVCEYFGPGKIWIQSRNLSAFADLLNRYLPSKS